MIGYDTLLKDISYVNIRMLLCLLKKYKVLILRWKALNLTRSGSKNELETRAIALRSANCNFQVRTKQERNQSH